ncbi:MAG: cell division protein FtsZ [Oscillospiraceae bacterium]|nr:cell division protein FtsZ [Oscillospiraceae bacterium]
MALEFDKNNTLDLDELDTLEAFDYDVSIKVVGVGGGGGNAVEHMAKSGFAGVEYLVVNTDVPALLSKDKTLMKRLQIGKKLTKGRGAGGKPEVGSESAMEDRQSIENSLGDAAMVFVAAGMGGGTGTGAAPVIAEVAKSMKVLTIGVVTKPFGFERERKMNTALKGVQEMSKNVDSLIVVPNQALLDRVGDQALTAEAAFAMVDDVLYKTVKSISEVLSTTAQMNVDFADLKTILEDSGIAHIAFGTGTGDAKAEEAVAQVVSDPLLETSIANAGKMLVYLGISRDTILTDIDKVSQKLTEAAHPDVEVILGYDYDDELKDTMNVTVVATSFMESGGRRRRPAPRDGGEFQTAPLPETVRDVNGDPVFSSPRSDPPSLRNTNTGTLTAAITGAFDPIIDDDDPYNDLAGLFGDKNN